MKNPYIHAEYSSCDTGTTSSFSITEYQCLQNLIFTGLTSGERESLLGIEIPDEYKEFISEYPEERTLSLLSG